jgi:acyl dehydratase
MPRLWAKTVDYHTVSVGDYLPILVKWETSESIRRLAAQFGAASDREGNEADVYGDELAAEHLALPGPAIAAYVTEALEKAFPRDRVAADGSSVEVDFLQPIRADETISISGEVVDKREEAGLRLVECRIVIEKEENREVAATVRAIVSL